MRSSYRLLLKTFIFKKYFLNLKDGASLLKKESTQQVCHDFAKSGNVSATFWNLCKNVECFFSVSRN